MPAERVSMRRIREILRLKYEGGATERAIARSIGVARSTVALTLERVAAAQLGWPMPEGLSDRALEAMLVCTTDSKHPSRWRKTCWTRTLSPTSPIRSGGRYHVYSDRRGLALPGRDPRPVHPQSGRLGHARSPAGRTDHCRAHHGNPTTTSSAATLRSATSPPNRQRQNPHNPVSTFWGQDHITIGQVRPS
jgi:hypothetical protein